MMRLHEILNARRVKLGWTYEDVHERLERYPWTHGKKPPALSTVGRYFNGRRRPRDMEHLKALLDILDISLDEAVKGAPGEAKTGMEQILLDRFRLVSAETQGAVVALLDQVGAKK